MDKSTYNVSSMTEAVPIIERTVQELQEELLELIMDEAKSKTPVNSGKAKAGWKIEGNELVNNVDYSGYLETGTSKNRPIGMLATTILDIDNLINSILS